MAEQALEGEGRGDPEGGLSLRVACRGPWIPARSPHMRGSCLVSWSSAGVLCECVSLNSAALT